MIETQQTNPERELILQAAATLFERYGYKKTTIDDIAQEAGIGKGTVYLRFESKEDIGLEWLKQLHLGLMDDLKSTAQGDPSTALRNLLVARIMLRFDIFARHCRSMDEAVSTLKKQVEERKRAFHEAEAELFSNIIELGVLDGVFRTKAPLEDARTMVLATNSLMPYSLRPEQLGDRTTVERQAMALADLLVRALENHHV